MPHIRAQLAVEQTSNPLARDDIVNVVHYDLDPPSTQAAWDALADSLCDVWVARGHYPNNVDQVKCSLYDMDEAEPREPHATRLKPISGVSEPCPREVALCLSFFATRNLPRRRGRIYVGPWRASDATLRPAADIRSALTAMATGLHAIGGGGNRWCVYSPTDDALWPITDAWVDDEWDTMRSRGLRATTRDRIHVGS
jgi:hypothetical protein